MYAEMANYAGTDNRSCGRRNIHGATGFSDSHVKHAALGIILAFVFAHLSSAAEANLPGDKSAFPGTLRGFFGIGRSRHVVAKLAGLFALDSFAGGFVV
jgi:hypothetical protein